MAQAPGERWWPFGQANFESPPRPKPSQLNDLRADPIPWRSDEMLAMMEAAIERYKLVVERGGWPQIASGPMLRLDDDGERVQQLKRRLAAGGDLQGSASSGRSVFDDRVEAAVRNFQDRTGLRITGRVDRPTLAQLNGSAAARLDQLNLNYRRIRELMQGRIEDRYILVNVAAYQLEAVEGFEVRRRHRVIVGKPDRQTPSVKATIKALNFFPYWRVPESVANLDLIPRLQREPEYLQKELIRALAPNGHEMDTRSIDWTRVDATKVRFRQDPGPQNALGLVRIDMPNVHTVYMHDTPMKPLFNQRVRPFSAGCVRVQDVFELVEWIGRFEPGWDRPGRAQEIVDGGQPVDVTLTRPLPVYFTYLTAWAEADGVAVFRPDVYGRDGSRELVGERDPDAPPPPQSLAP
jgi:murein L,D-transpeptidase YcbB/YkuD